MNRPTSPELIEDTQNSPDHRHLDIDKVGIKAIKHPILVKDKSGLIQHTNAIFSMYVHLPHNCQRYAYVKVRKNTRRISSLVHEKSFEEILKEMLERLESKSGYLEMQFTYFVNKKAPVSGVESLMDYDVSFVGEMIDGKVVNTTKVIVPVTSLCPCSKKISKYGAHNQRAHVTLTLETKGFIWIEDIIELVEKQASCELYGILKRPDEKYVTEKAYENPKFVEDIVRDIATELNADDRILSYRVESENFESIHNHSAYAQIHQI